MSEAEFTTEVSGHISEALGNWIAAKKGSNLSRLDPDSLIVLPKQYLPSGRVPVWQRDREWAWQEFSREIDVVLGRRARFNGTDQVLPIVAAELKVDGRLNSDILDVKNSVYKSLKEQYPCLLTCFVMSSNELRRLEDATLLRNCRNFDIVITGWDKEGKGVLTRAIMNHLDYAVDYWGR